MIKCCNTKCEYFDRNYNDNCNWEWFKYDPNMCINFIPSPKKR